MGLLVFADWDDPDLTSVRAILDDQLEATWVALGHDETHYDIIASESAFSFRAGNVTVSPGSVQSATIILYRRWRQYASAPVMSLVAVEPHQAFAEREWEDAVSVVLMLIARTIPGARWSQPPTRNWLASTRIALLLLAADHGIPVPEWTISSTSEGIADLRDSHVMKALNRDERVDADLLLGTTSVDLSDVRAALSRRPRTPVYLQERLRRDEELRIVYVFGTHVTASLTPRRSVLDIRDLPLGELAVDRVACPDSLAGPISHYCQSLGFGICVFDAMRDGGEWRIVDVTPNGGWAYLEPESDPWFSAEIALALIAAVRSTETDDRMYL